jgi:hypothetical protein
VTSALGYCGEPTEVGLPKDARAAERLPDPKQTLSDAMDAVRGRRRSQRVDTIFPAIAQRQQLERLRSSVSFLEFERRLSRCLQALGCLPN